MCSYKFNYGIFNSNIIDFYFDRAELYAQFDKKKQLIESLRKQLSDSEGEMKRLKLQLKEERSVINFNTNLCLSY